MSFVAKYLGTRVDPGVSAPDPSLEKARAAWDTIAPKLAARVDGFVQSDAPSADKVATAWEQTQAVAAAGNYTKALEAAKKIAGVINQIAKAAPQKAEAKGVGGVSLVKLGVARAEWPKVHGAAHTALDTLKSKMRKLYAPYPKEAAQLDLAVAQIDRVLSTLDDRLKEQLDDVYNAQNEDAREITIDRVRGTVVEFRNFVETDPVAVAIDGNSFTPGVSPIAPIRKNLAAMMAALGR